MNFNTRPFTVIHGHSKSSRRPFLAGVPYGRSHTIQLLYKWQTTQNGNNVAVPLNADDMNIKVLSRK